MPKVRELGITALPEVFRPNEVGGGGCGCTRVTNPCILCTNHPTRPIAAAPGCRPVSCSDCTQQQFSICGTTPGPCIGGTGCSDCTQQQFSICGTSPCIGGTGCSDCTQQQFSICGTSPCVGATPCAGATACDCTKAFTCTDCTAQPFSICGTSPCGTATGCDCTKAFTCTDCTMQQFSICGTSPCAGGTACAGATACDCTKAFTCTDCTNQAFSICGTTPGPCAGGTEIACRFATNEIFPGCGGTPNCGGTWVCGGSVVDPSGPRITPDSIATLKSQLQQRIAELEAHEATLGPQTADAIDAREKEIAAELDRIKSIRSEIEKSKK